ncbi:hypothetical protein HDU82_000014 [Entophlyctis luteolus]|nr:hypothetical protein HDU82_000014 [Entophlyctis luteolus]
MTPPLVNSGRASLSFRLAHALLVAPVRAIPRAAPCALLLLLLFRRRLRASPFRARLHSLATVYAALESLWAVYYAAHLRFLNSPTAAAAPPPIPAVHGSPAAFLSKCFREMIQDNQDLFQPADASTIPPQKIYLKLLAPWFLNARPESITRSALRTWLAWAAYSRAPNELESVQMSYIDQVMREWGLDDAAAVGGCSAIEIEDDHEMEEQVRCMRHTIDPVVVQPKPFVAYAVTMAIGFAGSALLRWLGFELRTEGKVWYWIHGESKKGSPIVFIHGIGVGLCPYIPFVRKLMAGHPNRPIILIEQPHISMRLHASVPTHEEMLDSLSKIPLRHNMRPFDESPATWIGHSLGTVACSWVCLDKPEWVKSVLFVDPVVFALWQADVCYNFLYREPETVLQLLMWYYVSQELHISYSIRRHFWWTRAILFADQLPQYEDADAHHPRKHRAAAFFSEHDQIINQQKVAGNLTKHGVHDVVIWKNMTHGEVVTKIERWDDVVGMIGILEEY